jgi:hypothetical protein
MIIKYCPSLFLWNENKEQKNLYMCIVCQFLFFFCNPIIIIIIMTTRKKETSVIGMLFQIQDLTINMASLTGVSREMAREDQNELIFMLAQATNSTWHQNVRLTIVDSNHNIQNQGIIFRNADGSVATMDNINNTKHLLVMPQHVSFFADDLDNVCGLIKLDESDVEWMAIVHNNNNTNYLLLRFPLSGKVHLISNAYGIRANPSRYNALHN